MSRSTADRELREELSERLYRILKAELVRKTEDEVDLELLDARMRELERMYNGMAARLQIPVEISFRFDPVARDVEMIFKDLVAQPHTDSGSVIRHLKNMYLISIA